MSRAEGYFKYLRDSAKPVPSSTEFNRKIREQNSLHNVPDQNVPDREPAEPFAEELENNQIYMEIDNTFVNNPESCSDSIIDNEVLQNEMNNENNTRQLFINENAERNFHMEGSQYNEEYRDESFQEEQEEEEEFIIVDQMEHDIEDQDDENFEDALDYEVHAEIEIDEEREIPNVNLDNNENAQFIYPGVTLTKQESSLLIMSYIIRHHATDYALDDLLDLINCHLPINLHTSRYHFLKDFPPIAATKTFYYCPYCLGLLPHTDLTVQVRCEPCKKTYLISSLKRNGHFFVHIPLKPQLTNIFSGPLFHKLNRVPAEDNVLSDVTSGSMHKTLREENILSNYDISLQWNADGVQTFKSSKVSMCPVQVSINELSYRDRKENILLTALWAANEKAIINLYFKPIVEELIDLHENGFYCLPPGYEQPVLVKVHSILSPVDSVERCALQNIHQFNGEYGCSFCLNKGQRIPMGNGFSRVYPGEKGPKRTQSQLERHAITAQTQKRVKKGVKGVSILLLLPLFNIIKSFVPEYMHSILLGVVKLFLTNWIDPKNHEKRWYLGTKVHLIDERLLAILPPNEITRAPQSVSNISNWKASEFKNFLQYYSLPVLKDILPENYYQHWSLLVLAVNVFNSDRIDEEGFEKATRALNKFVMDICNEDLYSLEFMKFNVHLLLHIPESVQRFGALWAWSAFPFESYNFVLRSMLHGSQAITQQICKSYLRFQTIKLDDTLLQPHCNAQAKTLYLKMMQNYRQRTGRKITNDNRLIVFGEGTIVQLEPCQKICIENLVRETTEELAIRYDRFIFKNTLHHSTNYAKIVKRNNSIISTIHNFHMEIIGIFCVMTTSKQKKYVVLGKPFQRSNVVLCTLRQENEEFTSASFLQSVEKLNNIVAIMPSHIHKKCIVLPYNDCTFLMELVNSVETE